MMMMMMMMMMMVMMMMMMMVSAAEKARTRYHRDDNVVRGRASERRPHCDCDAVRIAVLLPAL
jgi:hypothetical protein